MTKISSILVQVGKTSEPTDILAEIKTKESILTSSMHFLRINFDIIGEKAQRVFSLNNNNIMILPQETLFLTDIVITELSGENEMYMNITYEYET